MWTVEHFARVTWKNLLGTSVTTEASNTLVMKNEKQREIVMDIIELGPGVFFDEKGKVPCQIS